MNSNYKRNSKAKYAKNKTAQQTGVVERKKRKIAMVTMLIAAVFLLGGMFIFRYVVRDNETVAVVDGSAITAQELSAAMQRNKTYAITHFAEYSKGSIDKAFWKQNIENTTPEKYLRKVAFDELTRLKIEQNIAVSEGLLGENQTSYQAFLESMKKENDTRAEKLKNGEIVYGVKKYTEDSYYSYYSSNLSLKNQEALSKEGKPLHLTKEALSKWYDENKEERYRAIDQYSFTTYQAKEEALEHRTSEEIYKMLLKVRQKLEKGETDKEISWELTELSIQKVELNEQTESDLQKTSASLYEAAKQMKEGEVSEVLTDETSGRYLVIKCNRREDGGFKDFETYKEGIKKEAISENYEKYVDQLVKEAKVEKKKKYSRVCLK